MVPAVTTVDIGPVLDLSWFGYQERYPVGVEGVRVLAVHSDRPGEQGCGLRAIRGALAGDGIPRVAGTGAAELDDPGPHRRDDGDLLGQHRRHLALVVRAAAVGLGQGHAWHIDARHGAHDPEFHDLADHRITWMTCQRRSQRELLLRPASVVAHHQLVHQVDPVADRERSRSRRRCRSARQCPADRARSAGSD